MSVRNLIVVVLFVCGAAFAQESAKPTQDKASVQSPKQTPAAAKATPQSPDETPASLSTSKVTAVAPKQIPREQSAPAMVSLDARCASCDREVQGKITVNDQKISFCCASYAEPGAKVSAKCPYSFTVDLQQVKEQYLDTEGKTPTWHVVTRDDVAYTFATIDQQATTNAFDSLKKVAPTVKSAKMLQEYAAALAKKTRPTLAASGAACQ